MQNVQLGRTKGNLARRKGGMPGYDTPDPKPGSPVVGAGPTGLSAGSRKGVSPNLKKTFRSWSTHVSIRTSYADNPVRIQTRYTSDGSLPAR